MSSSLQVEVLRLIRDYAAAMHTHISEKLIPELESKDEVPKEHLNTLEGRCKTLRSQVTPSRQLSDRDGNKLLPGAEVAPHRCCSCHHLTCRDQSAALPPSPPLSSRYTALAPPAISLCRRATLITVAATLAALPLLLLILSAVSSLFRHEPLHRATLYQPLILSAGDGGRRRGARAGGFQSFRP